MTYRGDLEMQPEDAAGFTESGTEAYWADPDDDTVKYQLVNGIFTEVTDSDLVIPQILIEPHHEEVSADPNGVGTKEYWDGTDGNTYVWSEADNTYVIVSSQEALTIPQVQVILVNAVPATYTEAGHEAYYTDGNGHYYEKDSNDQYIERELDYFMTSALLGEHHEAAEAVPYEGGNAEYWESANEGMCYVSDGNGGYDEVSIESITQPAVGVKEAVPAKDPNYGTNGAGNVAYVVGSNDEIYVDDGTGHYVKTSLEAVTISALQLYMQADPINTQSAVDILIYAELPEGAIPEEYSVVFGGREVQFDSSFYSDSQGERLYKAMISAPAKNMATECSYSIKNGETVMFNGSQTTSIRKYALQVLNGDSSEAVKKCCRAMLAYGASAQILKNYDLENLASAGIEGEGLDYSGVELPDNFVFDKAGLNTVLENNDAPVRYYAMGLAMEAETRVNLAFLVTSGTQDDAVTFINENFSFGTKAVNAVKNGNTRYVVVTTDAIAIKDLLNDLSISYGGADYVINAQQYFTSAKSANIDIQNMCKALQNYYNYVAAKNN